ncbi:ATP-grasp domain-containing protein [Facklamia sp. P12950]|uniref:ATP-grasp domain-containing protein n=1 Tax=unclassified Facklamia TaxID=2622293 RepID=UPI003D181F9D
MTFSIIKKKKVMILGASILQLPAILKAMKMGLDVVVVDMNPNAVGFKIKGITKEFISTIDKELVYEAAIRNNIDGIMTLASDMPMRTVSYVAKKLNLNGISEDTALKTTSKKHMRTTLKDHHVAIPFFAIANSAKESIKIVHQNTNLIENFIFKPVDSSGSRGVFLLEDTSDENCRKAFEYSSSFSRTGEVIIEEFMVGKEVSVETFSIDGDCHIIQITDKITTGAPNFVEMGHSQPSELPINTKEKIITLAKEANKALGIKFGPSHTEIMVTNQGPKIVEIGARLGGDNIGTHLVPLSTGVDMVEATIRLAIGEQVDINVSFKKASAIKYIEVPSGIVKNISGLELAKNIKGVIQINILRGIGEEVKKVSNSVDRIGFVIAQAQTSQEANDICDKALNYLKIDIDKQRK